MVDFTDLEDVYNVFIVILLKKYTTRGFKHLRYNWSRKLGVLAWVIRMGEVIRRAGIMRMAKVMRTAFVMRIAG